MKLKKQGSKKKYIKWLFGETWSPECLEAVVSTVLHVLNLPMLPPPFSYSVSLLSCLILHSVDGSRGWELLQIPSTRSEPLLSSNPLWAQGGVSLLPYEPVLWATQYSTTLPGTSVCCYSFDLPPSLRFLQLDIRYSLYLPCWKRFPWNLQSPQADSILRQKITQRTSAYADSMSSPTIYSSIHSTRIVRNV